MLGSRRRGDVQRVTDHERRGLLSLERAELKHPRDLQPLHVLRGDLVELAVPRVPAVPTVHRPARRRLRQRGVGEQHPGQDREHDYEVRSPHRLFSSSWSSAASRAPPAPSSRAQSYYSDTSVSSEGSPRNRGRVLVDR